MDKQEFNIKSKTHTLRGVIENFATSKNAVILIHGSGNSDRDASVTYKGKLISQNFKLLAKYLTNSGLAVCRYDKRENAEIKQLKEDAKLVISYLKEKYSFDNIILYGWSEGVRVVSEIVEDKVNVDGLILQSGIISGWKNYFKYILGDVTLNKLYELDRKGKGYISLADFDGYKSNNSSSSLAIDTILLRKDEERFFLNPLITKHDSIDFEQWDRVSREIYEKPTRLSYYCGISNMEDWNGNIDSFKDYSKPVLLIHGLNDGWVSINESISIAYAIGQKAKLELFPCLGHSMQKVQRNFDDVGGEMEVVVIEEVISWISKNFI